MKNKRFIAALLTLVLVLSLAACGAPAASAPAAEPTAAEVAQPAEAQPAAAKPAEAAKSEPYQAETPALSDIDTQLTLIHSQVSYLLQAEGAQPWYYTVTDLDHNGSLEFIAASQHPQDRSTNLKIWEVSKDRSALVECSVNKDAEESFPDIMTDSADTFHDTASDTWSYLFYDNVVISDKEVFTSKSAFDFKDGAISYQAFAIEHTVVENNARTVSFMDTEGNGISAHAYLDAGTVAFANAERSSTGFEWLTLNEAKDLTRLVESYKVFMGERKPTENFPVQAPAAFAYPEATPAPTPASTPAPAPTPTPDPGPAYLEITKNPTNEDRKIGSTARFVACANAFEGLEWILVSPDGQYYSTYDFASIFSGSAVSGIYSTTLVIDNVSADMHNWGAYCVFRYKGQIASTSTAYIKITDAVEPTPEPQPQELSYSGYISDFGYDYVTVHVEGVDYFTVSMDRCRFAAGSGTEIYNGAPATVYCKANSARRPEVLSCIIEGREPAPAPVEACSNGQAFREPDGQLTVGFDDGSFIRLPAPGTGTYSIEVYGGSTDDIAMAGGGSTRSE